MALRISLVQTNIEWENKEMNLHNLETKVQALSGNTDLVVLPEMFATGFTMQSHLFAETTDGETLSTLRHLAKKYDLAFVGSFIYTERDNFFNRAFFISPDSEDVFYDKRHLFRMGQESEHFSAGNKRCIVSWKGWNICLMVCYDLRFPVWCRNTNNEYDLLIFVANWPAPRRQAWNSLLCARAIENLCYVCGVNRVGNDGMGLYYAGDSSLYNMKGENIIHFEENEEKTITTSIDLQLLHSFRTKFPAWIDADKFTFNI